MHTYSLTHQKEKVSAQLNKILVPGDIWYIIDLKWWMKWKTYVQYDVFENTDDQVEEESPGPIDNSSLLDNGAVKSSLLVGFDIEVIPEDTWDFLVSCYECEQSKTQVFQRFVVKMANDTCRVEVYPCELTFCSYKNYSRVLKKTFSRATTLDKIESWMRQEFSNLNVSTRLLTEHPKGSSIRLVTHKSDVTLEDADFENNQLIILDEKRSDGAWSFNTSASAGAMSNGMSGLGGGRASTSSSSNGAFSSLNDVYTRDSPPGVCGLSNLGNTCFMNSALQCMSNVRPLTEYFGDGTWEKELNADNPLGMRGHIATSYARLINAMWSGRCAYALTRDFKNAVAEFAPQFSGYLQHDSHELLGFLLDGLHEDLNRIHEKPYTEIKDADGRPDEEVAAESWDTYKRRNDSCIVDIFHGLLKSTVVCPTCNFVSVTFDPFASLSLPLPPITYYMQTIYYVSDNPREPIRRMKFRLPKSGSIPNLTDAVAKKFNANQDDLLVADVHQHKFYKVFENRELLSRINSHDVIYVYNVPKPEDHSIYTLLFRVNDNRIEEMFHVPMIITAPAAGFTYSHLADTIQDRIQTWLRRVPQPLADTSDSAGEEEEEEDMEDGEGDDERPLVSGKRSLHPMQKMCDIYMSETSFHGHTTLIQPRGDDHVYHLDGNKTHRIILSWTCATRDEYLHPVLEEVEDESCLLQEKRRIQIEECLTQFTTSEKLGKHDLWYCRKCKEEKAATKTFHLWSLPEVMVVHLKRFRYNTYLREKIETLIEFPLEGLDMTKWVQNPGLSSPLLYDLVAVSNHMGGLGGGHYTAFGKNFQNEKWYRFDDSSVCEAKETEIVTKSAYVLVYARRDKSPQLYKRVNNNSGQEEEEEEDKNSDDSFMEVE